MHLAGEHKHWMELEAQWLIHLIHYLRVGGADPILCSERIKRNATGAFRLGCPSSQDRLPLIWKGDHTFHLGLRFSTRKLCASHTARAGSSSPLTALSVIYLRHQGKVGIFHDSPTPKYIYFSNLGGGRKSPNTYYIFIISSRYMRENPALRSIYTSSTKY